jgi:hypothetical protein
MQAGRLRFSSRKGHIHYSLPHALETVSVVHPVSYPIAGSDSWGIKRQELYVDHSPPSSTEVKKGGATSPLHHASSMCKAYFINFRNDVICFLVPLT